MWACYLLTMCVLLNQSQKAITHQLSVKDADKFAFNSKRVTDVLPDGRFFFAVWISAPKLNMNNELIWLNCLYLCNKLLSNYKKIHVNGISIYAF